MWRCASASSASQFDLNDFLDRPTGKLSSGQKTRVSLAKALLNHPEVLLLDEPTASLDPDTADWVRAEIEKYRAEQGATILLASHNMGEVERLCDRVIMMKRGEIVDDGSPDMLLARYGRENLEEVFLDIARGRRQAQEKRRERARKRIRGGIMNVQPRTQPSREPIAFSPQRIFAMVLRYWYLLRSSWPRLLELIYWPAVQMLMWGFLQLYVSENAGFFAKAGGTFIGAVLLWDILFRGQLGFSISFLEEMWARNMGNLMMSPLRPGEFIAALMIMSIVRLAIGMVPVTILAMGFFGFNLYAFGFALAAFFMNLILTSWAVGIFVSGIVLRNGMGAESMAWTIMFLLLPLTCVYYPVSVLPGWLQAVAWAVAADLCVRRHAGVADRSRLPRRPDALGAAR